MSFPRYPAYKDSGVEWLGAVPAHWEVKRLKAATTHNDEVLDESTMPDTEIVYVDISSVDGVSGIKMKETMPFSAAPSRARRRVRDGDVIISTVRTYLKAIARIRAPEENLIVSTGFAVIRPRSKLMPDFLGCLVSASYLIEQVIARSTGVSYPAINASELVAIPVPLPPLPEQTQIATFLDRETAKIDELVAEQRRLMELLKEKRQAVISHAVTKGLNPDAPMKPSGIEWLGEVPGYWVVKRFQRCVYVAEGQVDPEDTKYSSLALIAPNHIESGTGRLLGLESASDQGAESGKYLCKAGDVVYSKIRPALRKVCIAPEDCLCSADMYPLRAHSGLTNPFLLWSTLSEQFSALAVLESQRVAMPKINRESLKEVMLAVPPIGEQQSIVAFIDTETAKLDSLTAEAQRAIDLLQERRTALISAAVTGQIDVRQLTEKQAA